jgi:hypothetical protein
LDLSQKPPPTLRTIHAFKQYSGKWLNGTVKQTMTTSWPITFDSRFIIILISHFILCIIRFYSVGNYFQIYFKYWFELFDMLKAMNNQRSWVTYKCQNQLLNNRASLNTLTRLIILWLKWSILVQTPKQISW